MSLDREESKRVVVESVFECVIELGSDTVVVQNDARDADALDIGFPAFEVYRDEADEWRWRLRH